MRIRKVEGVESSETKRSVAGAGTKRDRTRSEWRGEFLWRSVRYLACALGGYFLGLSAAGLAPDGPALWIVGALGALGLFMAFRSGKKSVQHAAADAVANARAEARAAAAASSSVNVSTNVAGGHQMVGPSVAAVGASDSIAELLQRLSDDDLFAEHLRHPGNGYVNAEIERRAEIQLAPQRQENPDIWGAS
jgi:hypothetical protein